MQKNFFKNTEKKEEVRGEVEPVILAELIAELKQDSEQEKTLIEKKKEPMFGGSKAPGGAIHGKNDSDYESMCLSNFESDINAVRGKSGFKGLFAHGINTDDGGMITLNDESATEPEMDFKNMLNVLSKRIHNPETVKKQSDISSKESMRLSPVRPLATIEEE